MAEAYNIRRAETKASALGLDLGLDGLELANELRVGLALDDRVELVAVVVDEAHALDQHVVDQPLAARSALLHPVIDVELAALPGEEARLHGGHAVVDAVAEIGDALALVELDLGEIGVLEHVGEELDELLALGRRALGPVAGQRALGRVLEVEDLLGDLADRAALGRAALLLDVGILDGLEHPLELDLELLGRLARARREGHG